jgi:hypothetical protein
VLGKELGGGNGLTPGPFLVKKLGSEKLGTKLSRLKGRPCLGSEGGATELLVSTGVLTIGPVTPPKLSARWANAGVAMMAPTNNVASKVDMRTAFSPVFVQIVPSMDLKVAEE